jgi:hypothetical protein
MKIRPVEAELLHANAPKKLLGVSNHQIRNAEPDKNACIFHAVPLLHQSQMSRGQPRTFQAEFV